MKWLIAFSVFLGAVVFSAAAQQREEWDEFPYALGAGMEVNMDTREGWARGVTAGIDRHILDKHLLVGLRGGMYSDYNSVLVNEFNLFLRAYFFKLGLGGAFTQVGGGLSSVQEDQLRRQVFLVEYTAGFRFFFLGGFYAEAYICSGYPFRWGLGVMGGHRFNF